MQISVHCVKLFTKFTKKQKSKNMKLKKISLRSLADKAMFVVVKQQTRLFVLIFFLMASLLASAQRKDTDAHAPVENFKDCRDRVKIGDAGIRILYAFNAENLQNKGTWIDEGQLKIGNGFTQYSSHFVEVDEDSLAIWLNAHPKSNVWPPARWLQGHKKDYWIEYQYSTISKKGATLEEYATMPENMEYENLSIRSRCLFKNGIFVKKQMKCVGTFVKRLHVSGADVSMLHGLHPISLLVTARGNSEGCLA